MDKVNLESKNNCLKINIFKLYFVALFFLFPLRRTILKCEKNFFLCYRDQKKWIKGKVCQLEAEGRELVMFPRFTFSDRDNIGNVFEHFKIVIRSAWNRIKQCNRVLFCIFSDISKEKEKNDWKKKIPRLGTEIFFLVYRVFRFGMTNINGLEM